MLSSLVPRKVSVKLVIDQIEDGIFTASMFNRLSEDVEVFFYLELLFYLTVTHCWSPTEHFAHQVQ